MARLVGRLSAQDFCPWELSVHVSSYALTAETERTHDIVGQLGENSFTLLLS